jgi:hypothetical protein
MNNIYYPPTTLPKTTCFLLSWGAGAVVIVNWELLEPVLGLTIDTTPGLSCERR